MRWNLLVNDNTHTRLLLPQPSPCPVPFLTEISELPSSSSSSSLSSPPCQYNFRANLTFPPTSKVGPNVALLNGSCLTIWLLLTHHYSPLLTQPNPFPPVKVKRWFILLNLQNSPLRLGNQLVQAGHKNFQLVWRQTGIP